ncbi:hypothetical protein [Chryseobacterium soli]|nr:hypothetical protein [Chryseobacterium soli]
MFTACKGGSLGNAELPAHTRQKIKGIVYNFTPSCHSDEGGISLID